MGRGPKQCSAFPPVEKSWSRRHRKPKTGHPDLRSRLRSQVHLPLPGPLKIGTRGVKKLDFFPYKTHRTAGGRAMIFRKSRSPSVRNQAESRAKGKSARCRTDTDRHRSAPPAFGCVVSALAHTSYCQSDCHLDTKLKYLCGLFF